MLRFSEDEFAEREARRERFKAGKIAVPERDVLAAVLEFLRLHPSVAWATRSNVGCGYLLRADQYHRLVAAGSLKAGEARFMRFGFKGAADITGQLRDGKRLEVECKADRGVVSDDQAAFLQAVNGAGGVGIVARSVDDVVRRGEIRQCGWTERRKGHGTGGGRVWEAA